MTSYLNAWENVLINRSNRPILDDNEVTIYVKDTIGLYQGKAKIIGYQNGRIYLTNRRILYCDNIDSSNSIGIRLSNVIGSEAIERFLRSSPKVKIFLRSSLVKDEVDKPKEAPRLVTWSCRICSYNNQISLDFDLSTETPKCVSCGIPPLKDVLKSSLEKRDLVSTTYVAPTVERRDDQCPDCTFINHPSMKYCELCGGELKSSIPATLQNKLQAELTSPVIPNKLGLVLEGQEAYTQDKPYIKLSFRKGGETTFREHLGTALDDIAWEKLEKKGGVNKNGTKVQAPNAFDESSAPKGTRGGIFALEKLGELQRKRNEVVLSSSLDDLEQLMFKFQDLIKLSGSFAKFVKSSNHNPLYSSGLIPPLIIKKTSSLYHQELARHISEYLVNDQLTKASSIITSQDCFANYNRFLILTQGFGTDLINPTDFKKAIELFDQLSLPVDLKYYEKSELNVLTLRSYNSSYQQFIVNFLIEQEQQFKYTKLRNEILGITDDLINREYAYFGGNTISEISHHLNWSVSITMEEIDKTIDEGSIVIDHNIAGTFYFLNKFNVEQVDDLIEMRKKIEEEILNEQRVITLNLKNQYGFESANNLINLAPDYAFGEVESIVSISPLPAPPSDALSTLNELSGLSFR